MATSSVMRLRWQTARGLRLLGWPGWAAAALAVAGVVGYFGEVLPMRQEALRLHAETSGLEERLARVSKKTALAEATPREQLADFEQRFVNDKGIAPALARLHASARKLGLQLDQAEFKFVSEPTEPLARYSMILPVKGSYRAVRRFSRQALQELPGMALEEVSFRRSDTKSAVLDAQVRFILFVKKSALPSTTVATP